MSRHRVCAADAVPPGEKRAVELEGRHIVVVRTGDGSFHALADVCPHQGARLSGGPLGGLVVERDGEPAVERGGEVLRCPWHNFAFDVRTGRSLLEPDRYRVRVYDVAVVDGDVIVEMPG
jgi:3-phenylpropionate/trans-cinnamate dioxygenase ferredoxin subunit